ncbi:hypothetical protein HPB49_014330 [Dermacentor silvarum]|uniref:Uncharacterized protein n=2 Tax=Dermacentor silvarum TaxID=543639 RepID=A0ACB8D5Y5_DERSI|nr:hypothetical protein HPB49_014330 [Dermacentor silvarum]
MLRNLATSEQRRLLDCYNNIWWSGQVPEAWRTAIVAPILKSNKPANELSSYRPVSLTSAACKVMEAIALARLEWVARACGFLADQQTGFRRRRCTADSIADVVSTLEDARASGDLAMLLLIDVKGAFDGLPHAVVQQALDLLGIGGNLRRFLSSFLNDRTLRVRVGHARSTPLATPEAYGIDKSVWQFDASSVTKASGLSSRLRASDMIVPFIILRNVLEFVRPIAAKLQKRDGDIVEAYNMIDKTIDRMKHVREQIESEYDDWFQTAEELALSVDTVITKPRLLGFQRNRANAPAADAREYYRLNVAVPFLDHVIQEMDSRFPKSDRVGLALLQLLPPAVTSVDLEKLRNDLLFWEIDLPAPCSLKMELREWRNFCFLPCAKAFFWRSVSTVCQPSSSPAGFLARFCMDARGPRWLPCSGVSASWYSMLSRSGSEASASRIDVLLFVGFPCAAAAAAVEEGAVVTVCCKHAISVPALQLLLPYSLVGLAVLLRGGSLLRVVAA